MHLTNAILPEGISVVLGENELSCESLIADPEDLRVVLSVNRPTVGACRIVDDATSDGETGCVASVRIVRPSSEGGERLRVGAVAGEGQLVLREVMGTSIKGDVTVNFPDGLVDSTCAVEGSFPMDDPTNVELETHCECIGANGETWTCSEPGDSSSGCCAKGADSIVLSTSFEATQCHQLCSCATLVEFCPCAGKCEAPPVDCGQACAGVAANCRTCSPELDCAALSEGCAASCESGFANSFGMTLLGCYGSSASCEELDDCIDARCEYPEIGSLCAPICSHVRSCMGRDPICSERDIQDCERDLEGFDLEEIIECLRNTPCDEIETCIPG